MSKKVKQTLKKSKYLIPLMFLSSTLFFTNCNKGNVEILDILDTVENCSLPYVVYFYPKADIGNGDVSYHWDFGDGDFSEERNPVHVYDKTGLYTVTLKIINKEAEDIKNKVLDLQSESIPIIADFDWAYYGTGKYAPVKFDFLNYSEHATSFHWDFDDGYESTLDNPVHEFAFEGTYNVKLEAICNNDTVTQTQSFTVLPPPTDLYIGDIRVWLPGEFLGANILCDVFFNGIHKGTSMIAVNIDSYPVVLPVSLPIYNYDYNNDYLSFEVWDEFDNSAPIYSFDISMSQIQDVYYPNVLVWDDGYDFAAEVDVDYGSKK